tara:strand:+ start:1172 stop:2215 length:1044 start_codon:yes stop_codon:yes gene_type:complete
MRNILITGGCGYIGSHTCIPLLENGYKLTIIDSNINSSDESIKRLPLIVKKNIINNISFEKGDIRNIKFLREVFSKYKEYGHPFEGVIHFAGLKSVGESVKKPRMYWDANFNGTYTLLKVMEEFKCFTIVFSSSASIYGRKSFEKLRENSEIMPINPYGHTKAAIEFFLKDIFESSNNIWRIANLRYFNPIGAHKSGLIGEYASGKYNNIFPLICLVASGGLDKISVFGDDWGTDDGTGVRDYIHVMDLAEAHFSTLKFLLNNKAQLVNLNIGTGLGTSVLELINKFSSVNDCIIPFQIVDRRPGDVASLVANNKKALSLLDWEPKRDLKKMCVDGWNWQKRNPNGY